MAAAQEAENHGGERDFTWYFWWGIYTSIPTWTYSKKSLAATEELSEFEDILPWIIFQVITKRVPISTKIAIRNAMNWASPLWMMESQRKLRQQHHQNFLKEGSHYRTNTSIRRNKWIQKSRTVRIIVWYLSRKANHLSKIVWERKTITELTISISSARIGKSVFVVDVKVSKDKHISRWVDQENRIYVRWNRIKKHAKWHRRWSIEKKKGVIHWVK